MKKSFKIEIQENVAQTIKSLEKQLVNFPFTEETRDCLLPSRDTIRLSTFDGKSTLDVYKTQYPEANS